MSEPKIELIIDSDAAVDIGDQGYALAWLVDPDGSRWPLLCDRRQQGWQDFPNSTAAFRDLAAHELVGALPDEFHQFRCGHVKSDRKPCRVRVGGPDERCRHHLDAPDAEVVRPLPRVATSSVQLELFDIDAPGTES